MSALRHEVLPSLNGAPDDLDDEIGPAGSRARLLMLEGDPRWETCYHRFTRDGEPVALVPVYQRRAKNWPSPLYSPDAPGQDSAIPPQRCVVVGGRDGMVSSLHVRPDSQSPDVYRAIMGALGETYGAQGLYLYLPHFRAPELDLFEVSQRWTTGEDARLDGLFGDWQTTLLSKQRATLRHDDADRARLGIETGVWRWDEVADRAAPLIAGHNLGKGTPEHGMLVDRRIRQWEQNPEFEILVFTADANDVRGVLVALIWREWMELLEIGLSPGHNEIRRCVYALLIAHLPAQEGKARGLTKLRAGPAARAAKAARGAVFCELQSALVAPMPVP